MTLPRNDKEILLYLYLKNLKNSYSSVHNELTRHENTRDRELGPLFREEGLSFHVCHFTSPFPHAAILLRSHHLPHLYLASVRRRRNGSVSVSGIFRSCWRGSAMSFVVVAFRPYSLIDASLYEGMSVRLSVGPSVRGIDGGSCC